MHTLAVIQRHESELENDMRRPQNGVTHAVGQQNDSGKKLPSPSAQIIETAQGFIVKTAIANAAPPAGPGFASRAVNTDQN